MQSWIKPNIPKSIILVLFTVALIGYTIVEKRQVNVERSYYSEQIMAAELMADAMMSLKEFRIRLGIPISKELDPNETGLIGEEFTDLTTTVGYIDAKRTATNPDFAALLVKYFKEADLEKGDYIAIGASGSFPSLILATLCACRVLELNPIIIYSVGSSMYGANIEGFTFVEMLNHLNKGRILPYTITGISMGGESDLAKGFFSNNYMLMMDIMEKSKAEIIHEGILSKSISKRMDVYERESNENPIACFVNIGGASANYGDTLLSLNIAPGLIKNFTLKSDDSKKGLIFEYGEQGIPVIHLLNVKAIAAGSGLALDPVPLPQPGMSDVYYEVKHEKPLVLCVLIILFLVPIFVLIKMKAAFLPF